MIGTCAISGTGGAQTWATKSCPIKDATGIHDLYFKFVGTGTGALFNFNWWKFSGPGADDNPSDGGATDGSAADAAATTRDAGAGGTTGRADAGTGTGVGGVGGGMASSSRTGGSSGNSGVGGSTNTAGASGRGGSGGATSAAGGSGGAKATSAAGGSGGGSQPSSASASVANTGGARSSSASSGGDSQGSKAEGASSGCGCNLGAHHGGGIAQLMGVLLGLLFAMRCSWKTGDEVWREYARLNGNPCFRLHAAHSQRPDGSESGSSRALAVPIPCRHAFFCCESRPNRRKRTSQVTFSSQMSRPTRNGA